MTCGGLCGIGKTFVLNQIDDVWQGLKMNFEAAPRQTCLKHVSY